LGGVTTPVLTWPIRVVAVVAAAAFIGLAFLIRVFTGSVLESTGLLEQASGTALYASAAFAGVVFLWPRTAVHRAALIAVGYCWAVEFLQLTPIPAELSARSVAARLVLGVSFDPKDLFWYVVGVVPPALLLFRLRTSYGRKGLILRS
jgi:hypothetical protein